MSSTLAAINGESCSIQSLTSSNAGSGSGNAKILNADDDTCYDVVMTGSNGDCKITTTVAFTETLSIPCTDYGADDGVVKLQLCSSGRTKAEDVSCDISGPYPSEPSMCYCETIAIPGVEIIITTPTGTESEIPTMAPILIDNGKEANTPTEVVYTPEPTTDAPITDLPTLAPITLEPTNIPTKAPVTPAPATPFPTDALEVVTVSYTHSFEDIF
jgi:hypothetical protein